VAFPLVLAAGSAGRSYWIPPRERLKAQARIIEDQARFAADAARRERVAAEKAEEERIEHADFLDIQEIRRSQGFPKPLKRPFPRIEDGDASGEDDPANYPTVAVMQAMRDHRWSHEDPTLTPLRIVINGYHRYTRERENSMQLHAGFGLRGLPRLQGRLPKLPRLLKTKSNRTLICLPWATRTMGSTKLNRTRMKRTKERCADEDQEKLPRPNKKLPSSFTTSRTSCGSRTSCQALSCSTWTTAARTSPTIPFCEVIP
jgi:hypothetical protein